MSDFFHGTLNLYGSFCSFMVSSIFFMCFTGVICLNIISNGTFLEFLCLFDCVQPLWQHLILFASLVKRPTLYRVHLTMLNYVNRSDSLIPNVFIRIHCHTHLQWLYSDNFGSLEHLWRMFYFICMIHYILLFSVPRSGTLFYSLIYS